MVNYMNMSCGLSFFLLLLKATATIMIMKLSVTIKDMCFPSSHRKAKHRYNFPITSNSFEIFLTSFGKELT